MSQVNNWDEYFLSICQVAASNSKCLSRQIGAILVRDKRIVSIGYNGPPSGVAPCSERWMHDGLLFEEFKKKGIKDFRNSNICPRKLLGYKSGEGLEWCVAGHGERNALINAAREGVCTKGTTMYMTCGIPCSPCLVEIINAGVSELVCTTYSYYDVSAKYLIEESKIKVRLYDFLEGEKLINEKM